MNQPMHFRKCDKPASQQDIMAAMSVMDSAFPAEYGEAWTKAQLQGSLCLPGMTLWLGGAESAVNAFALVRTVCDEAELMLIAVHPAARRCGLARALLTHIEAELKENAVVKFFLEMREGNPAEKLYQEFDFELIGLRRDYYKGTSGNSQNALTYVKKII